MDELVDVAAAREFLETATDPAVVLQTAPAGGRDPDDPAIRELRAGLYTHPRVVRLFDRQAPDGSWGTAEQASRRILPTLWMAKILAELGVTVGHPGLARAVDFLAGNAIVDGG